MGQLSGKLALVTGAGQGNGAAIAVGLAKEGARIILADVNLASAENVLKTIEADGGEGRCAALDVTDRRQLEEFSTELHEKGELIDILVNNAGICPRVPAEDPAFEKAWSMTIDVNLTGVAYVSHAFLTHLKVRKGCIVNIASVAAFVAVRSTLAYSASKAGVVGLTKAMAQEFAVDGIRVNAIAPGQIATPMLAASLADPKRKREIESRILLGRIGNPEDLVGPAIFLTSGMSEFVTGVTIPVDGGYLVV